MIGGTMVNPYVSFGSSSLLWEWWECDITGQVSIPGTVGNVDLTVGSATDGLLNGEADSGYPSGSRNIARRRNGSSYDRMSASGASPAQPVWADGVTFFGWAKYGNTDTATGRLLNFCILDSGITGIDFTIGGGSRQLVVSVRNSNSYVNSLGTAGEGIVSYSGIWTFWAVTAEGIESGDGWACMIELASEGASGAPSAHKGTGTMSGDLSLNGDERWSLGGRWKPAAADDTSGNDSRLAQVGIANTVLSDDQVDSLFNDGVPLSYAASQAIIDG